MTEKCVLKGNCVRLSVQPWHTLQGLDMLKNPHILSPLSGWVVRVLSACQLTGLQGSNPDKWQECNSFKHSWSSLHLENQHLTCRYQDPFNSKDDFTSAVLLSVAMSTHLVRTAGLIHWFLRFQQWASQLSALTLHFLNQMHCCSSLAISRLSNPFKIWWKIPQASCAPPVFSLCAKLNKPN